LKVFNDVNKVDNYEVKGDHNNVISNTESDILSLMKIRKELPNNPNICYLNINSLGNKIDGIREFCFKIPVDIFCVDETKLDSSYPDSQFYISGYQFPPIRKDRNKNGGGKLIYIRDGILAKRLESLEKENIETICLEITISKRKWCVTFAYRPPQNSNKAEFFNELSISLNKITIQYENIMVIGDLNIDISDKSKDTYNYLSDFCDTFSLKNITVENTCLKKQTGTLIDVMLTNRPKKFLKTRIF